MMRFQIGLCALAGVPTIGAVSANNPVSSVLSLLRKLEKEVQGEKDQSEIDYQSQTCTCKDLKANSSDQKEKLAREYTDKLAESEKLAKESANLKAQVAKAKEQRADAEQTIKDDTAKYDKEHATYKKETSEFSSDVALIDGAVSALTTGMNPNAANNKNFHTKKNFGFLQTNPTILGALRRNAERLTSVGAKETLAALMQQPSATFSAKGGKVVGMLEQMKKDIMGDKAGMVADFAKTTDTYETDMALLKALIKKLTGSIESKMESEASKAKASIQAGAEAEAALKSANGFEAAFAKATVKCSELDAVYQSNMASFAEDLAAISKAVNYLDSEAVRAKYTGKVKSTAFLQKAVQSRRQNALRRARASVASHPRIAALLSRSMVKDHGETEDGVLKVIYKISDMIVNSKDSMASEQVRAQECQDDLVELKDTLKTLNHEAETLNTKAEYLGEQRKKAAAQKEEQEKSIAETNALMAELTQTRKDQNASHQTQAKDNAGVMEVLAETKNILAKAFAKDQYKEQKPACSEKEILERNTDNCIDCRPGQGNEQHISCAAATGFVQQAPAESKAMEQASSIGQAATTKNTAGAEIISIITSIERDTQAVIDKEAALEKDRQQAYEDDMIDQGNILADTEAALKATEGTLSDLDAQIAKNTVDTSTNQDKTDEAAASDAALRKSCADLIDADLTMKPLQEREAAHQDELAALLDVQRLLFDELNKKPCNYDAPPKGGYCYTNGQTPACPAGTSCAFPSADYIAGKVAAASATADPLA